MSQPAAYRQVSTNETSDFNDDDEELSLDGMNEQINTFRSQNERLEKIRRISYFTLSALLSLVMFIFALKQTTVSIHQELEEKLRFEYLFALQMVSALAYAACACFVILSNKISRIAAGFLSITCSGLWIAVLLHHWTLSVFLILTSIGNLIIFLLVWYEDFNATRGDELLIEMSVVVDKVGAMGARALGAKENVV